MPFVLEIFFSLPANLLAGVVVSGYAAETCYVAAGAHKTTPSGVRDSGREDFAE